VAGPWVEGERLYALLRRQAWRASELLRRWISTGQVSVSRHLIPGSESFEVLTSEDGLGEAWRAAQNSGPSLIISLGACRGP